MAQTDYEEFRERWNCYMASREWRLLRNQVRNRSGGFCERCDHSPATDVHHLTYIRRFNECLEDLIDLCRGCHLYMSAETHQDPITACCNNILYEVGNSGIFRGFVLVPPFPQHASLNMVQFSMDAESAALVRREHHLVAIPKSQAAQGFIAEVFAKKDNKGLRMTFYKRSKCDNPNPIADGYLVRAAAA